MLYWSGSNGTVKVLIYRLPQMGLPQMWNMWQGVQGGGVAPPPLQKIPCPWPRSVPFGWTFSDLDIEPSTAPMWQAASEGGVALPPLQKGHNVSMCVILEWIKWYSEGFNLQAAIDGMVTGVVCAGKNTGWRGGSTTTTESSQPMTQVNPIWMNIQWPWHWTITVAVPCCVCA